MAYAVTVWVLGMRYASILWVLGFLLWVARMRWTSALIYTAILVIGLEALSNLLGVHLPRGVIPFLR